MNTSCVLIILLTMFLTLVIIVNIPGTKIDRYDIAIEECQKNLPRNQHCKIIAVIDDTNHD